MDDMAGSQVGSDNSASSGDSGKGDFSGMGSRTPELDTDKTSPGSGSIAESAADSIADGSIAGDDDIAKFEEDEDLKLQKLLHENGSVQAVELSEDQKDFNGLSRDKKLAKLQNLVEQSKIFSTIIADTLFEKTLNKNETNENIEVQPLKKQKGKFKNGTKNKENLQPIQLSSSSKETKEKLESTSIRIQQPKILSGCKMRDYQLEGMNWLITLYENGLNGILADEMGLGKTIQSISLLAFLYEQGIKGPFLITCPLSTVSNWCNEIKRFAPGFPVLNYSGSKEKRKIIREEYFHNLNSSKPIGRKSNQVETPAIIVASYEIIIRDSKFLDKIDWKFLIVDEGHRLKNNNCLLLKELKKLRTSNRLLLTGTPLQNNLGELWSLLNFILPDIFHDVALFEQWFDFNSLQSKLETDEDDEQTKALINVEIQKSLISNLHTILKPFLLRRLKREAIKDLPPKREYIIYANLTQEQTLLYKAALKRNLKPVLLKHFFKEYLKINNFKLGDDKYIENFINLKLSSNVDTIDDIVKPYNKSKKRKAKNIYDKLDLDIDGNDDFDYNNDQELDIIDYQDRYVEKVDKTKIKDFIKAQGRLYCEREYEKYMKLDKLWFQVKRDIDAKKLQNLMMQLRLICDSPYLFFFPWIDETKMTDDLIKNSGKLAILDQILPKLLSNNHKVLIFSQFTKMIDLIQDFCDYNNIKSARIDGSTDQETRAEEISSFNKSLKYQVFLLSTRAGGLGLNLVGADTVILFDSDWNPQVDLQAMDRAHRIGQTKPVIVYRMAMINTVEQVLLSKADSKRKLEKLVISMGKFETLSKLSQAKNANKSLSKEQSALKTDHDLLSYELTKLLNEHAFLTKKNGSDSIMSKDNILNKDELNELFDRSPSAYERSSDDVNNDERFKRIVMFETVSSME